jgi:transcriptional regulator with XRE-family HTH domain/tetratricopeptide (TPR) repeat protein
VDGAHDATQPVGDRLRRARMAARLSQEELAERTGLSVRAISDLERGRTRRPYPHTLRLLTEALGLPDTLADAPDEDQHPPEPADAAPQPPAAPRAVPRQLPATVRHFVARHREQKVLDSLLDEASHADAGIVVCVVGGTAGVGKTALAVHWAQRVAGRFPDGQLYVNLRGFDPTGPALTPAEAVRRFLDALDVDTQRLPTDLDAQAALYRTLLADRRVLVLLDNARDADQIRPLLPGSPGCLVVVTSRHQITPLVAAEGAHPIALDLLTDDEARELLGRRLGAERIEGEPDAAATIIERCARLPLALAIVAGRAATRDDRPLAALAEELAGAGLDTLSAGDPASDMRNVLSWSYRTLTTEAAGLFRLLGLHPGPDISAPAAASLAGLRPERLGPVLAELTQANLLVEHAPHRYVQHDLLRAYAAELAHTVDSQPQRDAAVHRLLDHYVHTAHAAAMVMDATRDPITVPPARPGVTPEELDDDRRALAWFAGERPVLLAALGFGHEHGLYRHTWLLAWSLVGYMERRGGWPEFLAAENAGLAAARRLGDPDAEGRAHRYVASAHAYLDQLEEARAHLLRGRDISARSGNRTEQAQAYLQLARIDEMQGAYADGMAHAGQALALFDELGHRRGSADALNYLAWFQALLGQYRPAVDSARQALERYQRLGQPHGEGTARDSLGYLHHHLGDYAAAKSEYEQALTIYRRLGDRYFEAFVLDHLADTHAAGGDHRAARDARRQALTILDDLRHPDADRIRSKTAD